MSAKIHAISTTITLKSKTVAKSGRFTPAPEDYPLPAASAEAVDREQASDRVAEDDLGPLFDYSDERARSIRIRAR